MAEDIQPAELDAYSLLSKPTLALTDAEVGVIVADLRRRRETALATGKPDKPKLDAKVKAEPLSKEAKAAKKAEATQQLLANLGLDL